MAQRLFESIRRLPGHLASLRRKPEIVDVHGSLYKINVCGDFGFPAKPTSIAYDPILNLIALLTRDGGLYVYGKPGVVFSGTHNTVTEFINVSFFNGERKLIVLTDSDDLYLWELVSNNQASVRLVQTSCLQNATAGLQSNFVNGVSENGNGSLEKDGPSHVTSICCKSDNRNVLIGTDHGWVASVRLGAPSKVTSTANEFTSLSAPATDDAITPVRILSSIAPNRHQRFRLDAVVVLSERPGFPGQLLIGYASGLSLIFDLRADRVVALLPWKHGLEAATWCGGNGLPHRTTSTATPLHLGMRLLTAHSDGSLGVWNLKETGFTAVTSSPASEPPSLSMEEPPTMPYGPFPCKLISKVFWLSSPSGGITAFVGGMPRATYGQRHTVSLLRGSNLDRAAAANVAAARIAAATEADDYDDEDDGLLDSSFASNTPMHVFDPDAPEHVCFDLPSRLVDLLPVGPVGGPAQLLLLLCEEELVAVDLLSPGWPFMRPPYLACLHTAAVTTYTLVTQVNPHLLAQLDAAGAYYGPEGRFGRGSVVSSGPNTAGWSQLPWPIQGGQALVSGSRLSSSSMDDSLLFTDDLLLTGHEDGSVAFWRLSAGGCLRRVYTLHSAVLFDGDFGLPNHTSDLDEDADSWPPFRQAGVFDPFMDDNRATVHLVRLVDNTLAVGGAAGQVTVWQFLDSAPPLTPVYAQIKTEIPGFKWKGHAPLKLRAGLELGSTHTGVHESRPPAQLQPVGVVFAQPPARCTALSLTEIKPHSVTTKPTNMPNTVNPPPGVVVALGTPHGYSVIYLPPVKPLTSNTINPSQQWAASVPQLLVSESTLPDNVDALQEAAAGEGWARRRTRELKNSLRDSFRRLKRMRSTKTTVPVDTTSSSGLTRAGLQRTITQSHRPSGRPIDSDPLQEAELRARGLDNPSGSGPPPISIEREICDRSLESASTAIVSYFTFGPPMFRFSSSNHHTANQPVGSLFVGTKSGTVKAYALFADRDFHSTTQVPSTFRIQLAKQLILQHRAPILNLRLVDSKSFHPWSTFGTDNPFSAVARSPVIPSLLVVSEEQVRLFSLPALRLRYKARITAKDGYRIKCGTVVSFRQTAKMRGPVDKIGDDSACGDLDRSTASTVSTPSHQLNVQGDMQSSEFSFVFTNVGGQAVVLNMPQLMRKDTFGLLDSNDVVAVSSVMFAEHGTSGPPGGSTVIAPSLGLYQLAPGQLTLFDVVRTGQRASLLGASYKPIQRLPDSRSTGFPRSTAKPHPVSGTINGSTTADSSGFSSRLLPPRVPKQPPFPLHSNTNATNAGCSASYAGSQVNSSMLSNTLSDSIRDCFTSPSDSSFASDHRNDHYEDLHAPRNRCNQ